MFNLTQMAHASLCISIDNIAVVLLSVMVLRPFIVRSQKKQQAAKPGFEEQNNSGRLSNSRLLHGYFRNDGHCFANSQVTNSFSPCYLLLHFFDKHLLHPLHCWTWSVLWRILPSSKRICLPTLHVPLLLDVSSF